jgi:hypothetical protein
MLHDGVHPAGVRSEKAGHYVDGPAPVDADAVVRVQKIGKIFSPRAGGDLKGQLLVPFRHFHDLDPLEVEGGEHPALKVRHVDFVAADKYLDYSSFARLGQLA